MAFDEALAGRIRKVVGARPGVVEKKMFGGVAFLLDGNMSVGVHRDEMIVRIAPEATDAALREKGVRLFDVTGRPMKGWLLVGPEAIETAAGLKAWITFAREWTAKSGKTTAKRSAKRPSARK